MKPFLQRFARTLVNRRLTLLVMSLAAASMLLMLLVPQRGTEGAASLSSFALALGLDSVATAWWFRVVVGAAGVQLLAATFTLARRDLRRLLRERGPGSPEEFAIESPSRFARELRRLGYLRIRRSSQAARYVRDPWGYAGPSLLHGGMVLAVCGVLIVTLTQSAGLIRVVEGQTMAAGTTLDAPRQGPLGVAPVLDHDLTLDRIDVLVWPSGEPRAFTGTWVLSGSDGLTRLVVTTNRPVTRDGVRYFQEQRVGYSFFTTITQGDVVVRRRIDLLQPPSSTEGSFEDVVLADGSVIRAKCLVDEAAGGQPELVLRFEQSGDIVAQDTVTDGASVRLVDMDVTVDAVGRWAIITIERSYGYGLLFTSFFVMFIGAILIYGASPRELTLTRGDDGTAIAEWHASRMPSMYAREQQRLRDAAAREEDDA
ncbi:MAG: hypothetical protein CVT66_09910 [Actinobacteria bacterium HGW-Actinobacteria-6]|jgi:hypothetical protein|nr:MAG: hypothetical protein CVT66_09910 [Actinobacteria bacterium HGW-Actinobacteria-6]